MKAAVTHVQDHEPVENVCNQTLRELPQTNGFSLAHVTVEPGARSLRHHHDNMTELYYVLDGPIRLHAGQEVLTGGRGLCRVLEPGTPHKLSNESKSAIEHLVVATPPFDPDDVHVHEDCDQTISAVKAFEQDSQPVRAADGALIYELFENARCSVAHGKLKPNENARPHFHKTTHELYYIIEGRGTVQLDDRDCPIRPGCVVTIPPGTVHGLNNKTDRSLEALCLCSPSYDQTDCYWDD